MLIYRDIASSLFKHNTLLLDYFHFRYFDSEVDKTLYTNVWDMYKFQSKYNSRQHFMIFRDKCQFRERFDKFFTYPYFQMKDIDDSSKLIEWIMKGNMNKVVVKEPLGAVGKGVRVLTVSQDNGKLTINNEDAKGAIKRLFDKGFILFEGFIEQHPEMAALSPTSVNTIRIVTFLDDDNNLEIWGTLLRMGYDKQVDNFDAGGLGAKIDMNSGMVVTSAIVKDPFDNTKYDAHPVTDEIILGKQIPFWDEIIEMVKECVYIVPEVRTVGWDFAITANGPTLIEGNDNWNRVLFQLATGIGLNRKIKQLINK